MPADRPSRFATAFAAVACLILHTTIGGAAEPMRDFLDSHCIDCHQGASADGGLDLDALTADLTDEAMKAKWVRIVDRIAEGEMPPEESDTIASEDKVAFVNVASTWIVDHEVEHAKSFGRVPLRRLTNWQVEQTLHDLLAIDPPLASLVPPDPRTDGYTTVADGQPMSHFQLQSHMTLVDAALDDAFDRAVNDEDAEVRQLSPEQLARTNPERRCREPEIIDDLAVTWASQLIFYGRLPSTTAREDGWYEFTFTASGLKAPKSHGVWCTVRSGACVSSAPLLDWVGSFEATDEPKTMTYTAWLPKGHMLEIRPGDLTLKQARFSGGQVGAGEGGPQNVPGVALHGLTMRRVFPGGTVSDVRRQIFGDADAIFLQDEKTKQASPESFSVEGKQLIDAQIIRFCQRAFRRPLTDEQARPYVQGFDDLVASGESPLEALKACYRAVLCSSRFMYFYERPGELDDYAIANRLSYFITGSLPDDELMAVAKTGKLRHRDVLTQQVDRLLATPRGKQFTRRFADEWLDLADINFTEPDRKLYRDFDHCVQNAMVAETRLYLQDMLERNASVGELIDSDHTFANSRLARYYDLEQPVTSDEMQRVELSPKDHRGGVMAHGSVLKVTANGTNTSPVLRGVWLCDRLLGVYIPPPPSSVPAIEPDIRGATTIREQLSLHRDDPNCASCHSKIDPSGFALEVFDPAGQFRTKYFKMNGGRPKPSIPIDSGYTLPDGRAFANFDEFQKLMSTDLRPIASCFVEHLLTYGTGTKPTFADRETIDAIVDQCEPTQFGFRSLLVSTVSSPTFLRK